MNGRKARQLRKECNFDPNQRRTYKDKKQYQVGRVLDAETNKMVSEIIKETGFAKVCELPARQKYKESKKRVKI